ncbi:ABC transporter ATP-binding protein [Bradyrhizobium sp. CCBAU 45384]|uniref:ABC transporter ATP-binding protein n=1 Tax=Bradyrhizobium sp. CCBAU 45384 TaxID=858428 RepID=UPI002305B3FC|nr:ABC transporter ATP-binding protein [Bradyrhizobium sp. CCBAU 45384]MDA9406169.1 peptide ABC transporter ATP-binding protein [Bradyrhizobium sp. CCBAU 45384]
MDSSSVVQEPILSVRDLRTSIFNENGEARVVNGVSFDVMPGEMLGVVGESGCGKSMTSFSILGLLPAKSARVVGGTARYAGLDLFGLNDRELRKLRGGQISMIFQEPMTSLNPVLTIGDQIMEALLLHENLPRKAARERAIEMLRLVRVSDPERRLNDYPHQFSGGMRQRVMIAMALACRPKLLIADEPTTALDVTIQAQILKLMLDLRRSTGTAIILITHDLGVVAETCDRVIVMYAGRKVEESRVSELFQRPKHPYTQGLLASKPQVGTQRQGHRLVEIPGTVPSPREVIRGCAFAPRCGLATERCRVERPELRSANERHLVACHHVELATAAR